MTTFDEREKGFETKFAQDEELKFRAISRRNRLLGLWAAAMLGKTGDDATVYAKTVMAADFEAGGDRNLARKVATDLAGFGINEEQIRDKMREFLGLAVAQISAGT